MAGSVARPADHSGRAVAVVLANKNGRANRASLLRSRRVGSSGALFLLDRACQRLWLKLGPFGHETPAWQQRLPC